MKIAEVQELVNAVDGIAKNNPDLKVEVDNMGVAGDQRLTIWARISVKTADEKAAEQPAPEPAPVPEPAPEPQPESAPEQPA